MKSQILDYLTNERGSPRGVQDICIDVGRIEKVPSLGPRLVVKVLGELRREGLAIEEGDGWRIVFRKPEISPAKRELVQGGLFDA